jgi:hypothetical protein
VYRVTFTLYLSTWLGDIELVSETVSIDISGGDASVCVEINVVGIVSGKICIIYDSNEHAVYLYVKLEAFNSVWETKIKLFDV